MLTSRLREGDVIVSPHGMRWAVIDWTPDGRLQARSAHDEISAWWYWRDRDELARGWKLIRRGVEIPEDPA